MNRRGLLKGLGAVGVAALWPGWLREAFAGEDTGLLARAATLSAAVDRARARLQPLLVFVIPKDDTAKYYRGRHFGEWLNHGADEDLAALACADVVCASMDAVRLIPGAPADGEPAILLLDTGRSPLSVEVALPAFHHRDISVEEELAPLPGAESMTPRERHEAYRAREAQLFGNEEAEISACIQTTGMAVRRALLGDPGAVERRAGERWAQLTSGTRAELRRIVEGVDGSPDLVLAGAPVLAADVARGMGGARLLGLLALAARARYCGQAIPGSEWAQTEGCAVTIEGESDDVVTVCGMGHVPARSQRFLYFLTRSAGES